MTNDTALAFQPLEALNTPDDGFDWFHGFSIGVGLGLIALSAT
ncbi:MULTISPECIES: daptide-type RiPP [unclassified Rathayibacter]|nr:MULTISPECIES: daptide-type RiPP [unclassified Rathayibacter]